MYKSQAGVRLPWEAGAGVGPVLSVGYHPHLPPQLGPGSWRRAVLQGDDWQERRGGQRGRLAQGPWPRVVVGVSSTDWVKALGLPLATLDVGGPSSGCKTERLRICSNIYWAHTWAWPGLGAELTGGEEDGNSG